MIEMDYEWHVRVTVNNRILCIYQVENLEMTFVSVKYCYGICIHVVGMGYG